MAISSTLAGILLAPMPCRTLNYLEPFLPLDAPPPPEASKFVLKHVFFVFPNPKLGGRGSLTCSKVHPVVGWRGGGGGSRDVLERGGGV